MSLKKHRFLYGIIKCFFVFSSFIFLTSCLFLRKNPPPVFQWPLKKYQLTQKFSYLKPHLGIDLKAPKGTLVFSSHSGKVIYAGRRLTGYGNTVMLEHSSQWASLYAHLDKIKVKAGQKIKQGDIIGTVGNTGRSSGVHLHLELMYRGKIVNPLWYLP